MWFIFALIAFLSWGCADLFYKKSTDCDDGCSHLKLAVWVGLTMGVFSVILLLFTDAQVSFVNIVKYSPASLMYILSMVIGYAGMRYLELSIISPVQNSSGALSAITILIFFTATGKINHIFDEIDPISLVGTLIITAGMIFLAIVERHMDKSIAAADRKYKMGALALIFPLLYCLFDTLGTAADGIILDEETGLQLSELDCLVAYGLTFFAAGVICWLYMIVFKKKVYNPFREPQKGAASAFETFGQFFYIYAMSANPVLAAPMIGSYCIVSVILSRIVLKEKLSRLQYLAISTVILGIVTMAVAEGIAEIA